MCVARKQTVVRMSGCASKVTQSSLHTMLLKTSALPVSSFVDDRLTAKI